MTASTPLIGARFPRRSRLIRLTPLIDVIFILLIFFMLASTLEDHGRMPLGITETGASGDRPDDGIRIELLSEGVRINGQRTRAANVVTTVQRRMDEAPGSPVTIRSHDGVTLQRLLETVSDLRAVGIDDLSLVPPAAQ